MEAASNLIDSDVELICDGTIDGMLSIISCKVKELKKALDMMRAQELKNQGGLKYFTVSSMSAGGTKDFHKGLEQSGG